MVGFREVTQLLGITLGCGAVASFFGNTESPLAPPRFPSLVNPSETSSLNGVVSKSLESPPVFLMAGDQRKRQLTVELTNDTAAEIVFLEPRSSCGCTIAQINPVQVPPGRSTQLQLEVDVTRLVGTKIISITIPTTDGPTWAVALNIPAFPQMDFERQETLLGDLRSGTPCLTSCSLDFYGPDRESLSNLQHVKCASDEVHASLQSESVEEVRVGVFRRRVDLQLMTNPKNEVGQRRVEVVATSIDGNDVRHSLIWQLKSPFEVSPPRVIISGSEGLDRTESVVVVRRVGNSEFTLQPKDALPDGVKIVFLESKPGLEQSFKLLIDKSAIATQRFFKIQLQSSIASDVGLEIPVIIAPAVSRADGQSSVPVSSDEPH